MDWTGHCGQTHRRRETACEKYDMRDQPMAVKMCTPGEIACLVQNNTLINLPDPSKH